MYRRSVVMGLGGIGALALARPAIAACAAPGALTEEDFRRYIAKFNANDFDGFSSFYNDLVIFEGQAGSFTSKAEVVRFYRQVKANIEEKVTVRSLVVGANGLAAELLTELHALADVSFLKSGELRKGERRASLNFVWYNLSEGKFSRVRSANYQRLPAPGDAARLAITPSVKTSSSCAPQITPAHFRRYIDAFNRADESVYGEYYDPDVILVLGGGRELRGRDQIFEFYRAVRRGTRRIIQVKDVLVDGHKMAVELESEFEALVDHPIYLESLRKGDRRWQNTVVLYDLKQGRFAGIRSASFRTRLTPAAHA